MIFATDLDRTMIYSSKFIKTNLENIRCIEEKDSKPISFITNSAIDALTELTKEIQIIPTTTRSIEQFKRVEVFRDFEYAITSNGGTILHHGEVLKSWSDYIESILINYSSKFQEILDLLGGLEGILQKPRVIDGKFAYVMTPQAKAYKGLLSATLDAKWWNFSIQGNKIYIIPRGISKEKAVTYLSKLLSKETLVVAGDGKLDVEMLEIADYAISPKHGEIYLDHLINRVDTLYVSEGIYAADEILANVKLINSRIQCRF